MRPSPATRVMRGHCRIPAWIEFTDRYCHPRCENCCGRELRRVHWGPVSVANWNTRFWCAMGLPGPLSTSIISIPLSPLLKQDQMSMAASIESRVPFLDHVLVEFAATIPVEFSVQGLTGKHILKAAV